MYLGIQALFTQEMDPGSSQVNTYKGGNKMEKDTLLTNTLQKYYHNQEIAGAA